MELKFTDYRLLEFETYEQYLDAHVQVRDVANLRNLRAARLVAELGYNSTTEMLSKSEFESRRAFAKELFSPSRKAHHLYSTVHDENDQVLEELAVRERPNRVGILSTIIFIKRTTKKGYEVSGYIDFEWSLRMCRSQEEHAVDWEAVFKGKKTLWPKTTDLGYYNWKTGESKCNSTNNYKALINPDRGLLFYNRHDRKIICTDPSLESPGINTTRTLVESARYPHVVLYDHTNRKLM